VASVNDPGGAAPQAERRAAGPVEVSPILTLRAEDGATATIHRHGAHVTSWRPMDGDERLYLSGKSGFEGNAAIRGGIPIIFPQFATEGPLPRHGFARTSTWSLGGVSRGSAGEAELELVLRDNPETHAIWDASFRAIVAVAIFAQKMAVSLIVENVGDAPFSFTAALHSYFRVRDVARAEIVGLHGARYRREDRSLVVDDAERLRVDGFLDRVYVGAPPHLELHEDGRRMLIDAEGFPDAVVWNPGRERAAALADLDPGGERHFLCIEAAAVQEPITLGRGRRWTGTQTLTAT
jgi:glucose-6-phosphate 1-epimerase